jgi:hypothetical protein
MTTTEIQATQAINVLFDGPSGATCGRFVEVELDDGSSINAGEWIERTNGLWALRITQLPTAPDVVTAHLTLEELSLLTEALDSHRYWQVADMSQRHSGDVRFDESDENYAELTACDDLEAKLQLLRR